MMKRSIEAELSKILEKASFADREQQKALYRIIAPKIYPYCLQIKPGKEAEDLLVKVFVELFNCLNSHSPKAGLEDWCLQFFWAYVKRQKSEFGI